MDKSVIRRRALRRDSTQAEGLLWSSLRSRQLGGLKFRRQHDVGPYILDFYCAERALVIELDGGQHFEAAAQLYDARTTAFLEAQGLRVLRFENDVVMRELAAVVEEIARAAGVL